MLPPSGPISLANSMVEFNVTRSISFLSVPLGNTAAIWKFHEYSTLLKRYPVGSTWYLKYGTSMYRASFLANETANTRSISLAGTTDGGVTWSSSASTLTSVPTSNIGAYANCTEVRWPASMGNLYSMSFGGAPVQSVGMSRMFGMSGPRPVLRLDASVLASNTGNAQIATWPGLDGTADATGKSDNGNSLPRLVVANAAASPYGQYVSFTAAYKNYFSLPNLTFTLTGGVNGVSFLLVGRANTTPASFERWFDIAIGAGQSNYIFARSGVLANTYIHEFMNNTVYAYSKQHNNAIVDGQWNVVCMTVTNGAATCNVQSYVNGVLIAQSSRQTANSDTLYSRTSTSNYVAKSNYPGDAFGNNDLAELVVLNSPLSANQVADWSAALRSKWAPGLGF